jgi:hypothetical protein
VNEDVADVDIDGAFVDAENEVVLVDGRAVDEGEP